MLMALMEEYSEREPEQGVNVNSGWGGVVRVTR